MKGVIPTPDTKQFFPSNTDIQLKINVARHGHSDLLARHSTLHSSPTLTVSSGSRRRTLRKILSRCPTLRPPSWVLLVNTNTFKRVLDNWGLTVLSRICMYGNLRQSQQLQHLRQLRCFPQLRPIWQFRNLQQLWPLRKLRQLRKSLAIAESSAITTILATSAVTKITKIMGPCRRYCKDRKCWNCQRYLKNRNCSNHLLRMS